MLQTFLSPDRRTALATSLLGSWPHYFLETARMPYIRFLSGNELLHMSWWISPIVEATQNETHLLPKTRVELRSAAERGHIIVAVDTSRRHRVVGCIVLWQLTEKKLVHVIGPTFADVHAWYELGTLWVDPEYRFHGERHLPIGDALYRRILLENRDLNILATTTNPKAVHLGARHGMQMISYQALAGDVCKATCVCPQDKTGTSDNAYCAIKDTVCRVRVPYHTWVRMGKPERKPYIMIVAS